MRDEALGECVWTETERLVARATEREFAALVDRPWRPNEEDPVQPSTESSSGRENCLPTVGHIGIEPIASGLRASNTELADASNASQGSENVQVGSKGRVQRSQREAPIHGDFAARLLHELAKSPVSGGGGSRRSRGKKSASRTAAGTRLLTVRQAAAVLKVSTWMIYAMVQRGELEHVRVSNAIRVIVRAQEK